MKNQTIACLALLSLSLSACTGRSKPYTDVYTPYQGFDYASIRDLPIADNVPLGPYESPIRDVVVPNTYHVNILQPPVSHIVRDQAWVDQQDINNYTIDVSTHEQATIVANTLMHVPKHERSAQ